jgi:Tfp pilus assembly protein PilX
MIWKRKYWQQFSSDEGGFAIVAVMLTLALITILGTMAIRTTMSEQQVSTNDELYKISFYAAEAARAYVVYNHDLYGSKNVEHGNPIAFPDSANVASTQSIAAASNEAYNGKVEYLTAATPPRGSGFQAGKFRSHIYQMTCVGYGPRNSRTEIEAGFYRVGF